MEDGATLVLMWCGIGGLVGAVIGSSRTIGAGGGFFLGALLGVIGWVILAFSAKPPAPTVLDRVERTPEQPGWHDDPLGRFDARWYSGERWTQHVGRVGADGTRQTFEDPL